MKVFRGCCERKEPEDGQRERENFRMVQLAPPRSIAPSSSRQPRRSNLIADDFIADFTTSTSSQKHMDRHSRSIDTVKKRDWNMEEQRSPVALSSPTLISGRRFGNTVWDSQETKSPTLQLKKDSSRRRRKLPPSDSSARDTLTTVSASETLSEISAATSSRSFPDGLLLNMQFSSSPRSQTKPHLQFNVPYRQDRDRDQPTLDAIQDLCADHHLGLASRLGRYPSRTLENVLVPECETPALYPPVPRKIQTRTKVKHASRQVSVPTTNVTKVKPIHPENPWTPKFDFDVVDFHEETSSGTMNALSTPNVPWTPFSNNEWENVEQNCEPSKHHTKARQEGPWQPKFDFDDTASLEGNCGQNIHDHHSESNEYGAGSDHDEDSEYDSHSDDSSSEETSSTESDASPVERFRTVSRYSPEPQQPTTIFVDFRKRSPTRAARSSFAVRGHA